MHPRRENASLNTVRQMRVTAVYAPDAREVITWIQLLILIVIGANHATSCRSVLRATERMTVVGVKQGTMDTGANVNAVSAVKIISAKRTLAHVCKAVSMAIIRLMAGALNALQHVQTVLVRNYVHHVMMQITGGRHVNTHVITVLAAINFMDVGVDAMVATFANMTRILGASFAINVQGTVYHALLSSNVGHVKQAPGGLTVNIVAFLVKINYAAKVKGAQVDA